MSGNQSAFERTRETATDAGGDPTGAKLHADSYHGHGQTPNFTFAKPKPGCEPSVLVFDGHLYPPPNLHYIDPEMAVNPISRDRNAISDDPPITAVNPISRDRNAISDDPPISAVNPISRDRNAISDDPPITAVNPISRDQNAISDKPPAPSVKKEIQPCPVSVIIVDYDGVHIPPSLKPQPTPLPPEPK